MTEMSSEASVNRHHCHFVQTSFIEEVCSSDNTDRLKDLGVNGKIIYRPTRVLKPGGKCVDSIRRALGRDKWLSCVNTVMDVPVS